MEVATANVHGEVEDATVNFHIVVLEGWPQDKREAWRNMTSSQRWQAAKEVNKKDWIGLDFSNRGRAMDHHSEDPHFIIATSPTTDDDAQKDTLTIPVATATFHQHNFNVATTACTEGHSHESSATDVEPRQSSSSVTEVVVRPEAFEQGLFNTEVLTQAVVFDFASEEICSGTKSHPICSTKQK